MVYMSQEIHKNPIQKFTKISKIHQEFVWNFTPNFVSEFFWHHIFVLNFFRICFQNLCSDFFIGIFSRIVCIIFFSQLFRNVFLSLWQLRISGKNIHGLILLFACLFVCLFLSEREREKQTWTHTCFPLFSFDSRKPLFCPPCFNTAF